MPILEHPETEPTPAPAPLAASVKAPVVKPHRSAAFEDDVEEPVFFQRHRTLSTVGALLIFGSGIFAAYKFSQKPAAPKRVQTINIVSLPPPPAPPPPPPPPPIVQPPEPKMIEQEPIAEDEPKPDDAPKDTPPDLGTNVTSDGPPDGFGLSGRSAGNALGGKGGNGQRSRWGWYASQVQAKIQESLRNNQRTRSASLRVEVRVWADATGLITRAQLNGTTGDAAVDAALKNEVLTGLQLAEPPPAGMPSPMVLRLTARRP